MKGIILFDGDCNLCSSSVQFIIKRDPKGKFKFASLQSETGRQLLRNYQLKDDLDTFVFIDTEKNKVFTKSTAALLVSKELSNWLRLLYPLIVIPSPIRDVAYTFVAKNRYKWFGKKNDCMLPTPELKQRFLE